VLGHGATGIYEPEPIAHRRLYKIAHLSVPLAGRDAYLARIIFKLTMAAAALKRKSRDRDHSGRMSRPPKSPCRLAEWPARLKIKGRRLIMNKSFVLLILADGALQVSRAAIFLIVEPSGCAGIPSMSDGRHMRRPMVLAQEFRDNAKQCLQMAETASDQLTKAAWQRLAEKWQRLEHQEAEEFDRLTSH
jgi:hypothetical protein